MKDTFDRRINYMRMSITDRCNLRCRYCMPNGVGDKVAMKDILRYEELVEIMARHDRARAEQELRLR